MLKCVLFVDVLPDVGLSAAGAGDLVLGEVCIVGRGDEVVGQRAAHVLVHPGMVWVNHVILSGEHVHGETILGHEAVLLSPVIKLIGEYEALSMIQRGVFSLVSQEVAQLSSGEHTTITGIVSEHGVELGPSQQLPAELLDLYVIQTAIP